MYGRVLISTALSALLLGTLAVPAADGFAGRNGRLAYGWSTLDEPELGPPFRSSEGIRTIKAGGGASTVVRQCVRVDGQPAEGDCSTSSYSDPSWSPDGTRIVFDAGERLGLLDGDGGALRLLPDHGGDDSEPVFSPSGTRLAYTRAGSVWVSDVYGQRERRVTAGGAPSWSARGVIAFARNGQLWTIRSDGSGARRLTGKGGARPAFSPHGTKIAFLRRGTVTVMRAEGGGVQTLRPLRGVTLVRWAPNGQRLVIERPDDGVSIANTDGTGVRLIVMDAVGATYNYTTRGVDWQPLR